jgi:hypothetical protein
VLRNEHSKLMGNTEKPSGLLLPTLVAFFLSALKVRAEKVQTVFSHQDV